MEITTGFCKPCLDAGHSCEATAQIDGVWMCVFCEDKEPCPKAGRKTCRQPGCFLVLPKLNDSGLCSGHEKQVADRAEKEQRLAAKEAKAEKREAKAAKQVSVIDINAPLTPNMGVVHVADHKTLADCRDTAAISRFTHPD